MAINKETDVISKSIFKRDSAGKIRVWFYEVNDDTYRTTAGLLDGNLVTSAWTKCIGKQGRLDAEQAIFEADAEERKKLDREYRRTIEELDGVPMSPMLAKSYDGIKNWAKVQAVFCQPKLDGIRALITKDGAFSREYQRHLNVDHILEALALVFAKVPDLTLDGELYNHDLKDDFNKITSIVRKQKATDAQREESRKLIQFHVYDMMVARKPGLLFADRSQILHTLFNGREHTPIRLVPTARAKTSEDLDELYGKYLEQGYEGQMVRLNAAYEPDKRSKTLLKRKEFITAEFPLVRVEEGLGNWAGYAKRIVFKLPDGRECGAGLRGTQDFCKRLLMAAPGYTKAEATIRYFTPTPDGMPRFPVAIDIHPDGRKD